MVCAYNLLYSLLTRPQRENVIAQLNRLLDSDASLSASAMKQNNLSLLQKKFANHKKDLIRLRSTTQEARNRANLLNNVRSDIDQLTHDCAPLILFMSILAFPIKQKITELRLIF